MAEYEDNLEHEITCPYCGYEFGDSWEYPDEDDLECYECGNKFKMMREVYVQYNSIPDCELNGKQHKWEMHNLRDGRQHEFCAVCDMIKPIS